MLKSEDKDLAVGYRCAYTNNIIPVIITKDKKINFSHLNYSVDLDDFLWIASHYDHIFPYSDWCDYIRFLPRDNGTLSGFHYKSRSIRVSDEYYISNKSGGEIMLHLSEVFSLVESIIKYFN